VWGLAELLSSKPELFHRGNPARPSCLGLFLKRQHERVRTLVGAQHVGQLAGTLELLWSVVVGGTALHEVSGLGAPARLTAAARAGDHARLDLAPAALVSAL
jgi:hypothetical protein